MEGDGTHKGLSGVIVHTYRGQVLEYCTHDVPWEELPTHSLCTQTCNQGQEQITKHGGLL